MQESRTSAYSTLRVKPCSGALGAEVEGLDASRPMDEETVAEVQRAFADHLILFFRDQTLTLSTFEAFAA